MGLSRLKAVDPPRLFPSKNDLPRTTSELRTWVLEHFDVSEENASELIRAIDSVASGHKTVGFFLQTGESEQVTAENLSPTRCTAGIVRLLRVPDGSVQVLLQGMNRIRLLEIIQTDPFPVARVGHIERRRQAVICCAFRSATPS